MVFFRIALITCDLHSVSFVTDKPFTYFVFCPNWVDQKESSLFESRFITVLLWLHSMYIFQTDPSPITVYHSLLIDLLMTKIACITTMQFTYVSRVVPCTITFSIVWGLPLRTNYTTLTSALSSRFWYRSNAGNLYKTSDIQYQLQAHQNSHIYFYCCRA